MIEVYRKPVAICNALADLEHIAAPEEIVQFAQAEKERIGQRVSALGLHLRLATERDIEAIRRFQARRFPCGTLLEDPYVLFRIIRFGYAPLIESPDGQIVACNLCQGHDDPDRTLWGIRNAVDPSVSGANLAAELANYSSLIGMERGSRVRRACVSPSNHASVANTLNHVGFVAEALDRNVPGLDGPRFILAMPLTPAGMRNNRIDLDKLSSFIDTHEAGKDYAILPASDLERVTEMYERTSFRVVAFLKAGRNTAQHAFFAVPEDSLGLPSK
jgi:hypothetical protein